MRYEIRHRTFYRYGRMMSSGTSLGHLTLRRTPGQEVISSTVSIDPTPEERAEWLDAFGNPVTSFTVTGPHDTLDVLATSEVELTAPTVPEISDAWESTMARLATASGVADLDARQFVLPSPFIPALFEVRALASDAFAAGRPIVDALRALTQRIFDEFAFDPAFSDVSTPLGDVLAHRRGVCQDFAHLMVGAVRSVGLAARYVSGYIETDPPPGEVKLVGADASHAWCSVYLPGSGWLDCDPTNNQVAPSRHITAAWGRDYGDVAPLRGVVLGPSATQDMHVDVDVIRLPDPD